MVSTIDGILFIQPKGSIIVIEHEGYYFELDKNDAYKVIHELLDAIECIK